MYWIYILNCISVVSSQRYEKFGNFLNSVSHNYTFKTVIKGIEMLSESYDIAMHLDNKTQYNYDAIVKYSREKTSKNLPISASIMTVNYDSIGPQNVIKIPESTRYVAHIIILEEPRNFVKYMLENKSAMDVAIFLCLRQEQQANSCKTNMNEDGTFRASSFLNEAYAATIYRVFVLDFLNNKGTFYSTCYYCGINSYTMKKRFEEVIESDVPSTMIDFLDWRIKNTFIDLEQHSLRLAFVEDDIYFTCINEKMINKTDETLSTCDSLEGIQGRMLAELARIMNFTYELVTPHRSVYAPWNNVILSVNESKAEWGIGSMTVTDTRSKMVTFSTSFGSDPLRYLYADPEYDFFNSLLVVVSFDYVTWIMLLISVLIISLLLSISCENKNSKYNWKKIFSENIWMIVGSLLEQSLNKMLTINGRKLKAPWLICAFIVSSAYKGKLSSMIMNPIQPGLLSIDYLAEQGYTPYVHKADPTFAKTLLKSSNDSTYKSLSSRVQSDLTICEAAKKSMTSKTLIINEQNSILFAINKECAKNMSLNELTRLRFPAQKFYPSDFAWPFRKRSPFINTINKHLMRMVQSGLYTKWIEIYLKVYRNDPIKVDESKIKKEFIFNDLTAFLPIFFLWSIGIAISCLFFILEILSTKIKFKMISLTWLKNC